MQCSPVILLVLVSIAGVLGQTKKPEYLRLCSRSDAELDNCLLEKIREMLPHLLAGDTELGLPALNPIHLNELRLDQDFTDEVKLRLLISDIYVRETDTAQVTGVRSMIEDSRVDLDVGLLFPKLNIEGDYRSDVRFRGLPFINKGSFNISLADVSMTLQMTGKKYERDGETYLEMQHVRMRPEIADLQIYISNLFGGANDLSNFALTIANRYWFIFYNENLPAMEERWDPMMTQIINGVLSQVPFDHIFPK